MCDDQIQTFREEEMMNQREDQSTESEVMIMSLNTNNSNYVWVDFTGTDVRALHLIDSGAQVSVLPLKLYNKLPREKQHAKMKSTVKIKAGNGTEIKCFGVAPVEFQFQGMNFVYNMYIVDDSVQPILGYDFLRDAGGSEISPSANTVKIRGKQLKLVTSEEVWLMCNY